jgi:WD40 repeat protein
MTTNLVAIVVLLAGAAPPTDRSGDPLPAGAVCRLGTERFRGVGVDAHSTGAVIQYSRNGKSIFARGLDGAVIVFDAETGRVINRLAGPNKIRTFVQTPNGQTLVTADQVTYKGEVREPNIRVWDLATGKTTRLIPQESVYELLTDGQIVVVHTRGGGGPFTGFDAYRLSDGTRILHVEDSEKDLAGWISATELALVEFKPERSSFFNLDIPSQKIRPVEPPHESPLKHKTAGPHLSAVGEYTGVLRVFDVNTRQDVIRIATPYGGSIRTAVSPDRKRVAVLYGTSLHLFDIAAGKEIPSAAKHEGEIKALAFTPDGRSVLSAAKDGLAFVWDVKSGEAKHRVRFEESGAEWSDPTPIALAPAGLRIAASERARRGDQFRAPVVVWDLATETKLQSFPPTRSSPSQVGLSPDGKTLVTRQIKSADFPGLWDVGLWDVATGQRRVNIDDRSQLMYSHRTSGGAFAMTADGRLWLGVTRGGRPGVMSAVHDPDGSVDIWDSTTGKVIRRFEDSFLAAAPTANGTALVGRALVPDRQHLETPAEIVVVEGQTGQERARFGRQPAMFVGIRATLRESAATPLAPSADGRLVAEARLGTRPEGDTIVLWDAATGTELHQFPSPTTVTALAFAPDGRTLASGGADGTILIWDVAPYLRPTVALADDEIDRCWSALASADAADAFRAMTKLANDPAALAKIRGRMKSAVALSGDDLAKWVRDLDSDQFAVRQRAAVALGRAGRQAETVLREAAAKGPSAEVRRQAATLLDIVTSANLTGERLADVRAVELLEWWGTAEARAVLAELAKGAPAADSTWAAAAALKRLSER